MREKHTLFGRAERVENDELFDHHDALAGQVFTVGKLSLGYVYDVVKTGPITWGVGALASTYDVPGPLKQTYGAHPTSWMGFVQARF